MFAYDDFTPCPRFLNCGEITVLQGVWLASLIYLMSFYILEIWVFHDPIKASKRGIRVYHLLSTNCHRLSYYFLLAQNWSLITKSIKQHLRLLARQYGGSGSHIRLTDFYSYTSTF